jgi:hypothetical protein
MLYKIDAGDIWLLILLTIGAFGVLVTVIILWGNAFSTKFPQKKKKKHDHPKE